jgi:hypothetical protein
VDAVDDKKAASEEVQHWLAEIGAAQKREKDFRTEGARLRKIYAGEKEKATPFNILFSNTETIAPALYSATPRPVVSRRYKDDDPMGAHSSKAGNRMLVFLLDTNLEGYETFDEAVSAAVHDSLLPGRGVSTVMYDAEIAGEGENKYKASELACVSSESWNRVHFGYAKKWSKMPWIAYEMYLDKDDATKQFGKEIAEKIEYTKGENEDGESKKADDDSGERKTACVYQVWDKKGGRKVRYISAAYPDAFLKVDDDPLELSGFFNCPRPIQFIEKTDDMTPTAPYTLYETQAEELNSLTTRIIRMQKAVKARGIYDSNLGTDIESLMTADDNELIPADKQASLAAEKGLQNAIWFMPLEMLITALRELIVARETCKQTIYEIMGIADILRGSSNAAETLGAQQIKTKWGSLRLRPKQGEVMRYVRDLLRMLLEIAATKFSQETWARMTGLPYLTDTQAAHAQAMAQAAAQQGQMEPMQQLQQAVLWKDVLAVLRDDYQRAYKIDIETNSTVEPEAMEDQQSIAEMLGAMGNFLNGVGPLVQEGIMPFEVAQKMLLAISRRFRFGSEIEDDIKQMQAPKPKPEEDKSGEIAAKDAQNAANIAKLQGQVTQLQTQLQQSQAEKDLLQRKNDLDVRELSLKTERDVFELEKQQAQESITNKSTVENVKLEHKRQVSGLEQKTSKADKSAADKAGQKVDAGMQTIAQLIAAISQGSVEQNQQIAQVLKAVAAPRKRTAVRGKDGRIETTIDEVVQ